jgi:murein DD-endopeptidase MepM/ murein hydrolase activator NlpD
MCDPSSHPLEPSTATTDADAGVVRRRLDRRQALLTLAAGAGAIAFGSFGAGSGRPAAAAAGPFDEPGAALKPAKRMILQPAPVPAAPPTPPAGKLIFPVQVPAKSNLYVLNNFGDCRGERGHAGIDILAAGGGNPIFAVASGQLVKWYTNTGDAGWGWTLYVSETKTTYKYFHMANDKHGLVEGSRVKVGDVLGFVGNSGTSGTDNYHLHFEVRPDNVPVNPLPLLDIPATVTVAPNALNACINSPML